MLLATYGILEMELSPQKKIQNTNMRSLANTPLR